MAIGKIYLTKRGRNLIAKGIGGQQIVFTRFGIGDGRLNGQAVEDLNNLLGFKKTVSIGQKKFKDTGILQLYGNLSNSEMGGFYFRELGLFATDPDLGEILYCYGNAGDMAEYIPIFQEEVYEKTILLNAYHGNAENVSAMIDESLVYATKEEVDEIYTSLSEKADTNLGNVSAEAFRSAFSASGLVTEVADKATIDKVDGNVSAIGTMIGNTADTGGTVTTGTVFAKLSAILQQYLSNWTATRAVKIDQLDKIGNESDTGTGTIMAKLNTLVKVPTGRTVKSIQSGFLDISFITHPSGTVVERVVDISQVSIEKSILITDQGAIHNGSMKAIRFKSDTQITQPPYTVSSSGTSSSASYSAFRWHIIEYN